MLVGMLVVAVPAAVLVGMAFRAYRRSAALADEWASERELELDDENRAMVSWYLRTSRTLRLLGILAGFVLTPLVALALGDRSLSGYMWLAAIAGYMVGIIYAEVALRRPRGVRAAVRPRQLRDYLSPWAGRAQRRTAAFAGVLAVVALVVPMRNPALSSFGSRVLVAVGILVVFVGVEAVQRWLIRRPQPIASRPLLEADDAIRCQSVHSIAGGAMGMQWMLAGAAMWALATSDVQVLRWTMWLPAMASWIIGLAVCTRYDNGGWQIKRTPSRDRDRVD